MTRADANVGYHPWFTHRYSLLDPLPSKEEHYRSIFFKFSSSSTASKPPNQRNQAIFTSLLPYLPEPIPFGTLLDDLRRNIITSLGQGRLTMLGEVGLDGGARMRWPKSARHLYDEKYPVPPCQEGRQGEEEEEEEEWNRLTPFKVSMEHQKTIVEAQLEVAIDLGVNVSFHSVAAPGQSQCGLLAQKQSRVTVTDGVGPTMEVLTRIRNKHRSRFTNRINVDIHSAGGWSPEFWTQAEASPSIPLF